MFDIIITPTIEAEDRTVPRPKDVYAIYGLTDESPNPEEALILKQEDDLDEFPISGRVLIARKSA
jgi:hypothetical protein